MGVVLVLLVVTVYMCTFTLHGGQGELTLTGEAEVHHNS